MNIQTILATEYQGKKVYIRNFGNVFEYLVLMNGELYTAHMVVTKRPLQALFGKPYTKTQIENITKYLMSMAQATIEHVSAAKK